MKKYKIISLGCVKIYSDSQFIIAMKILVRNFKLKT